jgi:rhamnogalacturonan endolyase
MMGKNFKRNISLVTCLFLFMTFFTVLPAGAATVWSDSFDDGNANGWSTQYGAWSVVQDGGNYVYYQSSSSEGRASAGSQSWTDYSVAARVKVENWNGSNRAYVAGRYQDGNNYYAASLYNSSGGKLEIRKKAGGSSSTLASKNYGLSAGTWYDVKLELNGSTLNMYVNGQLQLTATDSSLGSGGVGLIGYKAAVKYDDVVVSDGQGGSTPTPTPTATPTTAPTPTPTATPTAAPTPTPTVNPSATTILEAEDAALSAAFLEALHSGYTGSGYVNYDNAAGGTIQWAVQPAAAGNATLEFRYANGTANNRPGEVRVNGSVVNSNLAFNSTGAWNSWQTVSVQANLNAGANTIQLKGTGSEGGANIDHLKIIGAAVQTPTPTPTPVPTSTPTPTAPPSGARQMEDLDRGLVAIKVDNGVYVGWRLLGTEAQNTGFNVYRNGTKLNSTPITGSTNYLDSSGSTGSTYQVRAVVNGQEQAASGTASVWGTNYLSVPLQIPSGGTTPDGVSYTYSANDASVGDLDGDGQYEIVLKWDPSNSKDNSQSGYTGNVYIDAYELNGTRLWRIDLGRNIRAGAHYTQFMVYDLDGDGRAEVAMKTADGTRDGKGTVIGSSSADYRNSSGYVLSGPEYLTVFEGTTGRALATANYNPPRGTVSSWGDSYGNRVDRFLAGIAYIDGVRPSLVMARGYYTRTVISTWNYRNGALSNVWTFDSNSSGNSAYAGQGNHNLSTGDVDGDGKDEIMYGAMAVNDNGTGMYTTGWGHGDAMHFGDLLPTRAGLEVFGVHESTSSPYGAALRDARTGQVIWGVHTGADTGRGMSADIDPRYAGEEMWASGSVGLYAANGTKISSSRPSFINFGIWWDADPMRELLDSNRIDKWNYSSSSQSNLLTASGVVSNNGTKSTPSLQADLLGDWREEVIWRTSDSSALRIYSTTAVTNQRIHTLMHDPIYRMGVAWQNTAYNQPPHPSFFLGNGMSTPPQPSIYVR